MFASLVTLLLVLAGLLVMISGALPGPSDERLRRFAGRLALMAVAIVFLPVIVSAIPTRYIILALLAASFAAFVVLEHRVRDRRLARPFMNYRTGGKRLIEDDESPSPPYARREEDDYENP